MFSTARRNRFPPPLRGHQQPRNHDGSSSRHADHSVKTHRSATIFNFQTPRERVEVESIKRGLSFTFTPPFRALAQTTRTPYQLVRCVTCRPLLSGHRVQYIINPNVAEFLHRCLYMYMNNLFCADFSSFFFFSLSLSPFLSTNTHTLGARRAVLWTFGTSHMDPGGG